MRILEVVTLKRLPISLLNKLLKEVPKRFTSERATIAFDAPIFDHLAPIKLKALFNRLSQFEMKSLRLNESTIVEYLNGQLPQYKREIKALNKRSPAQQLKHSSPRMLPFQFTDFSHLQHLDLSNNSFKLAGPILEHLFDESFAQSGITHLNLSRTYFAEMALVDLKTFFVLLGDSSVHTLDLSRNRLANLGINSAAFEDAETLDGSIVEIEYSVNTLAAFLEGLAITCVKHLDLSYNDLDGWPEEERDLFCTLLSKTKVKTLDLSGHDFSEEQLEQLNKHLPQDIIIAYEEDLFVFDEHNYLAKQEKMKGRHSPDRFFASHYSATQYDSDYSPTASTRTSPTFGLSQRKE